MHRTPPKTNQGIVGHVRQSNADREGSFDQAFESMRLASLRRRLAERVRSGKGVDRGEALLAATRQWHR
ncbi:MAG TPA: hypothetical protein VGS57_08815 [Thermoanaerobaculia bacterium]|jgi:hypothetical protein|nr:hypothetical protein [Thermoanaerobaculia bacterium]